MNDRVLAVTKYLSFVSEDIGKLTKNDLLDVSLVALKLAGVSEAKQKQVAAMLSEHYDTE